MSRRSGSPTSSPSGLPATCTASSAPSSRSTAPSWPCRSLAAQTVNSSGIRIGGTSGAAMAGRGYHRSVRSAVVATPGRGLHLVHVCSGSPNLAADVAPAEGIVTAPVLVAEAGYLGSITITGVDTPLGQGPTGSLTRRSPRVRPRAGGNPLG